MAKSPTHVTGRAQYDGKLPFVVNSPVMSGSAGSANQGTFVAPCDCELVQITKNLISQPTVAAFTVDIGTRADPDGLMINHSVGTSDPTGTSDIPLSATEVSSAALAKNINKGDVIEFGTGSEATANGDIALSLVFMPR